MPRNGNGNKKQTANKGRRGKQRGVTQTLNAPRRAQPLMYSTPNTRPLVEQVSRMRGSDFVTRVQVKPASAISTAADRILATFPVTPSGYVGTRITGLANFWERYKLRRFNARYVPAVPMTIACQFVLYIDTDPNDDPTIITDADALIRQAVAQTGAQQWNFNNAKVVPLAKRADDQLYYTGVDKQNMRFNRQGTAYLIQLTDPLDFNGAPITGTIDAGTVFVDWDVEFQIPQIEPALVEATLDYGPLKEEVIELDDAEAGTRGSFTVNTPCLALRTVRCNARGLSPTDSVYGYAPTAALTMTGFPDIATGGSDTQKYITSTSAAEEDYTVSGYVDGVNSSEYTLAIDQSALTLSPNTVYALSTTTTPKSGVTYIGVGGDVRIYGPSGLLVDFTP